MTASPWSGPALQPWYLLLLLPQALLGTALRRRLLVVDVLGLLCVAGALAVGLRDLPGPLGTAAALALLLLGRSVRVPLRLGERRVLVSSCVEGAVVLTVLVVPPAWVPLLAGLVTLAGQVPRRLPWWRSLFNTCALVVPVTAAAAVYALVAPEGASPVRTATALLLACPVAGLLNLVAVSSVVAAAHGERWWPSLRRDLPVELGGTAVQAGVCASAVACWAAGQVVAAALVPLLGVVVLRRLLERLHRATEEDALQRLEAATRPVAALDTAPAAGVVLGRAGDLFGVDAAQLVVLAPAPGQPQRAWTWTRGDGTRERLDGRARPGSPGGTTRHALQDDLGAPLGELLLHFPRPPQLSGAEQHVLAAFLATAAHTLERCRDVAHRAAASRRDPLTGLGNRLDLEERLHELGEREPAALLLFALGGLRRVRGTFGDAAGERLLGEVASRLRAGLRAGDVALRLGNEDFAVLLRGLSDDGGDVEALQCAQHLVSRLEAPFAVDDLELPLEPTAGLALTLLHGRSAEQLVRRADAALAECARTGLPVVVHGTDAAVEDDSVLLLGQLQSGLRRGEIEVHYQPVVALADGRVVGAEALVRWRHPELGLLSPARFVPLAEQTRLVVPLTLEVLDQAVGQAAAWRSAGGPELSVAVNLSPRCLLLADLADQVLGVLALYDLPPRLLVLEITETLALSDLPQVHKALDALRSAGVRLSLDDFGTGFSSMTALRSFAVDEVKVDRSFVAAAPSSPGDRAVVTATVALARSLGLPVVAEGVETQEQLELVRRLGCDYAQGHLLGRARPAAELSAFPRG